MYTVCVSSRAYNPLHKINPCASYNDSPIPPPPPPVCTESGKVFVFGRNKYGELGLGHGSSQAIIIDIPTPLHSINTIVKVVCGLYHSAAIDGEMVKIINTVTCGIYTVTYMCVTITETFICKLHVWQNLGVKSGSFISIVTERDIHH